MLPMSGDELVWDDLTSKPIFTDALEVLKTPRTWLEATMASINQLYDDPPEERAHAICATVRFMAIAEELYRKKVVERPFWLIPDVQEMQVMISSDNPLQDHSHEIAWV